MKYEDLIRAVGPGFHPDNRAADYTSLPEGLTPELYDEVVQGAFDFQEQSGEDRFDWADPYKRALKVFQEFPR